MAEHDCPQHHGNANEDRRQPYDDIMQALPRNQSGEKLARHACAICAYERGRTDYRIQVAEWLGGSFEELLEPEELRI